MMIMLYQNLVIQKSLSKRLYQKVDNLKLIGVVPVARFRFLNVEIEAIK